MEDNANKEQFMQDLGVTTGSVASVTKEMMLENLEKDVQAYETALDSAKKELANYKEQFDLDLATWDILLKPGALRKIVPEREFEKDPLYWELAQKKQAFAIRQDRAIGEGQLKKFEEDINNTQKGLDRAREKLLKFRGE